MNPNLLEAAREGDISKLEILLSKDGLILDRSCLNESAETALHVAVFGGHREFVKMVLNKKPDLATRLNQDGFNALRIASANGFVEIATDLLTFIPEIGRSRSSDSRTALHFAAKNGNVCVIRELINLCPSCKNDMTFRGETALHLAVKNGQFEAFMVMVEMLKQRNVEELLNVRNEDENTALHYAAAKAQFLTIIRYVIESENINKDKLEVNAKNKNGFTAVELFDAVQQIATDRSDYKIREVLVRDRANNNVTIAVAETESSTHNVITQRGTVLCGITS